MRTLLVLAVGVATVCHGAPLIPTTKTLSPPLQNGWQESPALWNMEPDRQTVPITLAVRERNLDELRTVAHEVSDPRHERYGKFLSTAQIDALIAPSPADVVRVTDWLGSNNITFDMIRGRIISCRVTAKQAELPFATSFRVLVNPTTQQSVLRAKDYSLPSDADASLDAIFGLHGLPLPPRNPVVQANPDCTGDCLTPVNITPAAIKATYKVSGVTPRGSDDNRQAVASFTDQTMKAEDLSQFFKAYVKTDKTWFLSSWAMLTIILSQEW